MLRTLLSFLLLSASHIIVAQRQFPADTPLWMDSIFVKIDHYGQQKNLAALNESLASVDKVVASLQDEYPSFGGIVSLYESFYSIEQDKQGAYMRKAVNLFGKPGKVLTDSFHSQFLQLIRFFNDAGRMNDWLPADSVFRKAVAEANTREGYRYALTNYAGQKLAGKEFLIAKNIALYDKLFLEFQKPADVYGRMTIVYNDWIALKSDLQQWNEMPYEKRNIDIYQQQGVMVPLWAGNKPEYEWLRKVDFKERFSSVISDLKKIRKDAVIDNRYGSASFNKNFRYGYYSTYIDIINNFCSWSVKDHRQSAALLPLKEFLMRDLIPNEMDEAAKAGQKPAVGAVELSKLYADLSAIYYNVGNGAEAREVAVNGQVYITEYKQFTVDEAFASIMNLLNHSVRAYRLEGKFADAHRTTRFLKKYIPRPDSLTATSIPRFEQFAKVYIEEIYTLAYERNDEAATDSLSSLIDAVNKMHHENEELIYTTEAWTELQFLVASQVAKQGSWKTSLIGESMDDLENGRTHMDIFYPTQLLHLKALWHDEKKFYTNTFSNLLFYTGRQLQDNFIRLTPEDRMRLYEQRLSPYFDVYHEMIFSGALNKYPELKEKAIAQSLYLKNALADGNILPDELLMGGMQNERAFEIAQRARELRQETNLRLHRSQLGNYKVTEVKENRDQLQAIWLGILEGKGMDSLVQLPDWKKLCTRLKAGQVYMETVRYKSWLSDSMARYGAYILLPTGKMHIVSLYREDSLMRLLQDPVSSPQTASLGEGVNRGAKVGVAKPGKKFKQGDIDQLGALVLAPIWKFISGNQELLVVQDGLLNRISFAALQWQKQYLLQYVQLRQLSGSYMLSAKKAVLPANGKALLGGGLDYLSTPASYNRNRLFSNELSWQYLPGTKKEIDQLQPLFRNSGLIISVNTSAEFPDSLRKKLSDFNFIHLATHGFYFDTATAKQYYSRRWNSEGVRYEPLYRCGIAMSGANNPDSTASTETDGYLLGYELANTDLRRCYLISLSACETGLGDVRNNLGVDGLSRALKLGGARHLLISLWKVPDEPTAIFMQQFYKYLFAGKSPAAALQATQLQMSKTYAATDWAAFILVE